MKTADVDPMLRITLQLAAIIDPAACGQLKAEGFDIRKIVDPKKLAAIDTAKTVVGTICMVVEQEYAAYFARAYAKGTQTGNSEPN